MDEELLRLAQQAESAGYTTSEQIVDRLVAIVRRQRAYLARRQARRQVTAYDGVVNEDSQVIAACIWLMHPTLVGVHPRGETDEAGRS